MLSVCVSVDSSEIILLSCYLLVVSSDSTTHVPLPDGCLDTKVAAVWVQKFTELEPCSSFRISDVTSFRHTVRVTKID